MKGYLTECFKTFNFPQDLKHYDGRFLASINDEFLVALGVIGTYFSLIVISLFLSLVNY